MAHNAISEIVCKYLMDNGFAGLKCDEYPDPYGDDCSGCSCNLVKLLDCESICSKCYPFKEYLHDDGNYYPYEQVVITQKEV